MKSKSKNQIILIDLFFSSDIVQDCSLDTIQVQHNDIIILSSDGLWDVIKTNELQKIIQQNENKVKLSY